MINTYLNLAYQKWKMKDTNLYFTYDDEKNVILRLKEMKNEPLQNTKPPFQPQPSSSARNLAMVFNYLSSLTSPRAQRHH